MTAYGRAQRLCAPAWLAVGKMSRAAIMAATALTLATGPVLAQKSPAGAKPIKITVTNKRTVPVTSLGFVLPGADTGGRNLLKSPLAPGKSIVVTVPAKKGECVFDVLGSYEDEVEISGSALDVCKDKSLTLVD